MRLIDVDVYCATICKCNRRECNRAKCPIHNAPTAYDVDKVVEELEMEMKASSGYSAERVSAFSRAIEIVKRGGVRNEVAEYV